MTEKQLISTIKYVSGTKPAFFLSEIIPYLDESRSLNQLFSIISPKLPGLGLMAKEVEGDFEISRIPPALPLILSPEERERQEAFFTARVIPAKLAQSIEKYLTKKVGKDWNDPVIIERLRRAIVA